jgi:hypothetical protein
MQKSRAGKACQGAGLKGVAALLDSGKFKGNG